MSVPKDEESLKPPRMLGRTQMEISQLTSSPRLPRTLFFRITSRCVPFNHEGSIRNRRAVQTGQFADLRNHLITRIKRIPERISPGIASSGSMPANHVIGQRLVVEQAQVALDAAFQEGTPLPSDVAVVPATASDGFMAASIVTVVGGSVLAR
jgi:hypothetical protein